MNDLAISKNIGTAAVMQLRKDKLASGKSFLIYSDELPAKQSYMEYPDGSISIVTIAPDQRSFAVICKLSDAEAQAVRDANNLK